jgi:hypothetical protein
MSDDVQNEETAVSEDSKLPKFETAFLLIKSATGSWHVLTDLSAPLEIEREATHNEVRAGAAEVAYSLGQQQLAALIVSALSPQGPDSAPQSPEEGTIRE